MMPEREAAVAKATAVENMTAAKPAAMESAASEAAAVKAATMETAATTMAMATAAMTASPANGGQIVKGNPGCRR
jgi:hypothetical protein